MFSNKPDHIYLRIVFWLWSGILWTGMMTVSVNILILLSGVMIVLLFILPIPSETRKVRITTSPGTFIQTHSILKFVLCLLFMIMCWIVLLFSKAIVIFWGGFIMQFFMSVFNDALKEHKKEIFALNVDVY